MQQKQSDPFYHTTAWKKARAERLRMDHGMCAECMRLYEAGLLRGPRRATVVHHVKPLKEYPELALRLDNLESLCERHHNEAHPEKGQAPEKRGKKPGLRVIKV